MSALAAVLDVGGIEVARVLAAVEERLAQVADSLGKAYESIELRLPDNLVAWSDAV